MIYVEPSKDKKLATNTGKSALLKSAGATAFAASTVGGFSAAAAKLGSSESKATGVNEELEKLRKQIEELQSDKETLETQNKDLKTQNKDLQDKVSKSKNGSSGLKWWHALLIAYGCLNIIIFVLNAWKEKRGSVRKNPGRFFINALLLGIPKQLGYSLNPISRSG